jgi:hypothetical protein
MAQRNSSQSPQAKRGSSQDHEQFAKGTVPKSFDSVPNPDSVNSNANSMIGASEKDREGGFPPGTRSRR